MSRARRRRTRPAWAVHDRYQAGDPIPARLYAADLMWLFAIRSAWFYQLRKVGRFDRFELRPTIGRRCWSGKLVAAYFEANVLGSTRFLKSA